MLLAIVVGIVLVVAGVFFVIYMVSKISAGPVAPSGRLPTMFRGLVRCLPLQSFKVVIVMWQILTQASASAGTTQHFDLPGAHPYDCATRTAVEHVPLLEAPPCTYYPTGSHPIHIDTRRSDGGSDQR